MSKKVVLPGEEVAVVEEYIPSEGTYEEDGKIMASMIGELELDEEEKTAKVFPKNPMVILKPGTNVFCRITDSRASMAICEIVAVEGKDRENRRGYIGDHSRLKSLIGVYPGCEQRIPSGGSHKGEGHTGEAFRTALNAGTTLWGIEGTLQKVPCSAS